MAKRTYPIAVVNPECAETDKHMIKGLMERGALTQIYDAPSVTTITAESIGMGWGMVYSAVSLTKQGKNFEEEWGGAADRGTAVHSIAENLYQIKDPSEYPEELQGYVKALLNWRDKWHPEEVRSEFVVCGFGKNPPATIYAGRVDKIVRVTVPTRKLASTAPVAKSALACVDYKTCKNEEVFSKSPKGYLANQVELVARAMAMPENEVDVCCLVRLAPNGSYQPIWINRWEWEPLMECFNRCQEHYNFCKEHRW